LLQALGLLGPGKNLIGIASQRLQGQAAVAAPLHLRQHGGGHQQRRPGLGVLRGDKGRQGAVQAAQQARIGQSLQRGQPVRGAQCH
jgi:hypothetical protein